MLNKFKIFLISLPVLLIAFAGCKKGTFDINSPNPNVPSGLGPDYVLPAALTSVASLHQGGNSDFANLYMGYWAVSGDFIPNANLLQYNLTTDFYAGNWDASYLALENFRYIATSAPNNNYVAISKIMSAYLYERLVDLYNNVPYTEALNGGTNNYPSYQTGATIYPSLVNQLDSAVNLINGATSSSVTASADIMFKGNMQKWARFANTLKLRLLMNLTQTSGGPAYITSHLTGLTPASFLQAGEDASVNPGYSNSQNAQQSPLWQDLGFNTTGTPYQNNSYYRANAYAVNFYTSTNDPRLTRYYAPNSSNAVKGRQFGSTALEHNSAISGFGPGLLVSPTQSAIIFPASESFFLQAEAMQRGYISGSAQTAYQTGVTESFRLLGVPSYATAAAAYYGQNDARTNWAVAPDKIALIITQAWAAYNTFDPIESYNNWRRLGIPADIPVSIYPGTTASHIPYRLQYPTSEYSYNTANVQGQGTINPLTNKVFFQP